MKNTNMDLVAKLVGLDYVPACWESWERIFTGLYWKRQDTYYILCINLSSYQIVEVMPKTSTPNLCSTANPNLYSTFKFPANFTYDPYTNKATKI